MNFLFTFQNMFFVCLEKCITGEEILFKLLIELLKKVQTTNINKLFRPEFSGQDFSKSSERSLFPLKREENLQWIMFFVFCCSLL